ncbi:MAG: DUF4249 domain-containing protein [Bacteroidales bacterium]|nr:DUF4249 domain-containing protein [Bacteroidales bacterium]
MHRFWYISIFILVIVSCQKVYEPDVSDMQPFLVVEGRISTIPGSHMIRLTYSKSYNESPYANPVSNARVEVIDDEGNIFTYHQFGQGGYYKTNLEEYIHAKIGHIYVLRITTSNGDIYESTPQLVVKVAPIDSITANYSEDIVLVDDGYGGYSEIQQDGFDINVNITGIHENENYYIYDWSLIGQFRVLATYPIDSGQPIQNVYYDYQPLSTNLEKIIATVNANQYLDKKVRDIKLLFLSRDDFTTSSTPCVPDTFDVEPISFDGVIMRIFQHSLSKEAYEFWHDVQKQLESSGQIFDPVASQIKGNIKCVSDSTKIAFGVFYASDVSEFVNYLYINSYNHTYSKSLPVDFRPEAWMDSCFSNIQPDTWIMPPF